MPKEVREYCKNCGRALDDPHILPLCGSGSPTNGWLHEIVRRGEEGEISEPSTANDPALPTDLDMDMSSFLSESDQAEIKSLSADKKTERTRIFTHAMGKMLADIVGNNAEEKDAIAEGYQRLLETILPVNSDGPGGPLDPNRPPGISFPFPSAAGVQMPSVSQMPTKFPELPSGICIESRADAIYVADFSQLDDDYQFLTINFLSDGPHAILRKGDLQTELSSYFTIRFLAYLHAMADYYRAFHAFASSNHLAFMPMDHSARSPQVRAAEIDQLLALPPIKSLLERFQATEDPSNA